MFLEISELIKRIDALPNDVEKKDVINLLKDLANDKDSLNIANKISKIIDDPY